MINLMVMDSWYKKIKIHIMVNLKRTKSQEMVNYY